MNPAVRITNLTKQFPGVVALDAVSLDVAAGTCHAICGENGAGKSTLGKILCGLERPDGGEILLEGRACRFTSPRDALAAGVAMVHQELAFCDNLTVAENLCLSRLPRRFVILNRGAMARSARAMLDDVGADVDPSAPMHQLSVAEQQVVQIAGAVAAGARVIVFDEPTSSLGEAEAERLFARIGRLLTTGVTVLYVSHRMPEIFRLCSVVSVLRDGRLVATRPTAGLSEAALVESMIGRQLAPRDAGAVAGPGHGDERLRLDGLSSPGRFAGVSLTVHAGEIVGLAGLVGAGRSEIAHAVFGLDPGVSGSISVRGRPVRIGSPRDAMALGIGYVPEDRKRQGLVLPMRTRENVTLPTIERLSRLTWIQRRAEIDRTRGYFDRLRVRADPETATLSLSGGNQQKIVLAKWLAAESDILMLDEPTRGIDVGAKGELHAWIRRLAAEGVAVLLISSELPELLDLSSRILVVRQGRLVGELAGEHAGEDAVLRLMAGLDAA
ncbi:MAG TPA: sugar ABC transporter ATP-binding protein [Gemmatimonadaceae bacterium]|nr:sugar ABC transporter ATP-binding protein [Gemmatimonadaceae bacterium]